MQVLRQAVLLILLALINAVIVALIGTAAVGFVMRAAPTIYRVIR